MYNVGAIGDDIPYNTKNSEWYFVCKIEGMSCIELGVGGKVYIDLFKKGADQIGEP